MQKTTFLFAFFFSAAIMLHAQEDGLQNSVTKIIPTQTAQYFSVLQLKSDSAPEQVTRPCPPRFAIRLTEKNTVSTDFTLNQKPSAPLFFYVEGCGTAPGATLQATINGKQIYSAKSPFYVIEWNRKTLTLMPEHLNAGKNTVEFKLKNTKKRQAVFISEMTMIDPNGSFAEFAAGGKSPYWTPTVRKNESSVQNGGGKVILRSDTDKGCILSFFRSHSLPKIAVEPKTSVKFTITASGKGKLAIRLNAYHSYPRHQKNKQKVDQIGWRSGLHQMVYNTPVFDLTPQPKTFTFRIQCNPWTGLIFPAIDLKGKGEAVISDFRMELTREDELAKVQNFELRNLKLNHADGYYRKGEEMVCTAQLFRAGKPALANDGILRCVLKWEGQIVKEYDFPCQGDPVTIRYKAEKPGWLYLGFQVLNTKKEIYQHPGKGLPQAKKKYLSEIGAIWEADQIKTALKRPVDFDAFWKKQKAILAQNPMNVKIRKMDSKTPGIELYGVEVSSPTDRPVTAYLAVPAGAQKKSLPLQIDFLSWTWCDANRDFAIQAAKNGALGMAASWHGFPVGKDRQFYINSCRKFFNPHQDINNRDKWSFRDVYVRVLRALEFAKSRPEWNEKDLIVMGGSLGGAQTIVAAALDPQVSLAIISVPCFAEFNGKASGRKIPIPFTDKKYETPEIFRETAYFDMVHFAQNIKCEVFFCTGFADELCPPSNVFAIYNGLPASTRKIMTTNPRTGHYGTTKNIKGNARLVEFFKQTTVRTYPGATN